MKKKKSLQGKSPSPPISIMQLDLDGFIYLFISV